MDSEENVDFHFICLNKNINYIKHLVFAAIIDKLDAKIHSKEVVDSPSENDEEKKWRQYVVFSLVACCALTCMCAAKEIIL